MKNHWVLNSLFGCLVLSMLAYLVTQKLVALMAFLVITALVFLSVLVTGSNNSRTAYKHSRLRTHTRVRH